MSSEICQHCFHKIFFADTSPAPYQGNLSPYAPMGSQFIPNLGSSPNYILEKTPQDVTFQYHPNVTGNTQYGANASAYGNSSQPQVE